MAVEGLNYFIVNPVGGTRGGQLIQRDYDASGDNIRFRLFRDYGIRVMEINGLYDIPVRYTDRPRFGAPGSFPSPHYVGSKDVTINMRVTQGFLPEQDFQGRSTGVIRPYGENLERARNIFQPQTDDLGNRLVWFERGVTDSVLRHRFLYCRVIDRSEKQTVQSGTAKYTDMVVRFRAEDPNIYSFQEQQINMQPFQPFSGIDIGDGIDFFDLGVPGNPDGLDFPATSSLTVAENLGNRDAFTRLTVLAGTVPIRVVEVDNFTTGVRTIFAAKDLVTGEDITDANGYTPIVPANGILSADMNPNTRSITVDGVNRFDIWRRPQIPFALAPGQNDLKYTPDAAEGGTLQVRYRHTWL